VRVRIPPRAPSIYKGCPLSDGERDGDDELTVAGWNELLAEHGLEVRSSYRAPLHLLEPRRLVSDEGPVGAVRFVGNVLRDRDALARVRGMRSAMRTNAEHLQAYGVVARRSEESAL
jgi:hypothetical protein